MPSLFRVHSRHLLILAGLSSASLLAVNDLTVQNTTYTTTQSVQADNSITATPAVTVASGADIRFQAGGHVTLGSGFKVNLGGLFRAYAGQTLPYTDGFETAQGYASGTINNQRGWTVGQGAAALSTADWFSGASSLSLLAGATPARVAQGFTAYSTPGPVFLDFYMVPVAAAVAADSTLVQTEAARIGFQIVSGQGKVYAFDGTGANVWVPAGNPFNLNGSNQSSAWVRLTLRVDYAAKKWDLYVNGVLAEYDLAFTSISEAYFRRLEFSGVTGAAAYVDAINAGFTNPLFTDADKDGMPDAWEISYGLNPAVDDRNGNPDGDAYTNIEEYFYGTPPNSGTSPTGIDTDADGLADSWEMLHFGNLTSATGNGDNDGDGVTNAGEYAAGTNPTINEQTQPMPGNVQVVLRQPNGTYLGVKLDWSVIAVP